MRANSNQEGYDIVSAVADKFQNKSLGNTKVPMDAKEFVFKYARTYDPHWEAKGMEAESSPFPQPFYTDHETGEQKQHYLDVLIDVWNREKNILVAKSRQLMVTWLFCALNLHLAISRDSQAIFFISKKEDDAGLKNPLSLVSRSKFIFDHLPEDMKPRIEVSKQPPIVRFPDTNSFIQGVSQDAEALRMYTASVLFSDEMAFQDNAETAYAAMKPTIAGGGRLIGVSTPNGKKNLFHDLVHDKSARDEE